MSKKALQIRYAVAKMSCSEHRKRRNTIFADQQSRICENGSAIFYIFIAVAMLAALSFAVAQSSRSTGKGLTEDRAKLAAAEVMAYGDTIAKSVGQLRLRGIQDYAISFAHINANATYGTYDTEPRAEIFNPQGGGVIYRRAPDLAGIGAPLVYNFIGAYAVDDIGSTCATPDCSELLMTVQGLRKEVCQMMNSLLDMGEVTDDPPADDALPVTPYFAGNAGGAPVPYSFVDTIGEDVASSALLQASAGCYFHAGSSSYIYFQVLLSR